MEQAALTEAYQHQIRRYVGTTLLTASKQRGEIKIKMWSALFY